MSLRWKNQRREPDYANPDLMGGYRPASAGFAQEPTFAQVLGAQAAQQMQGYVPGPTYDGYASSQYASDLMRGYSESNPYNSTAFDPRTASKAEIKAMQSQLGVKADGVWGPKSQAAYDAATSVPQETDFGRRSGGDMGAPYIARREQVMQKIQQLEARLSQINASIAEIDKSLPAGAGNDKAWEIAAQRASIGDMSAYDSMVQRGATGYQTANAIDNALMDAEKLTWGLSADSAEDRMAARNQIEVALRKAKRDADQTGTKLPDSYYRLQAALDKTDDVGPNGMTAMEYANDLASKIESNEASDTDIKAGLVWAAQHPNSKYAKTIFDAAIAGKGKTEEAKGRAKAYKAGSDSLFNEAANMSKKQLEDWWRGLSNEKKTQFKKYHKIDLVKGKVE